MTKETPKKKTVNKKWVKKWPQKTYNRDAMKLEYFLSPEMSIGKRLQENHNLFKRKNWNLDKKTRWRYWEKIRRIKEISNKIQDDIQDDMLRQLWTSKKNILKGVMKVSEMMAMKVFSEAKANEKEVKAWGKIKIPSLDASDMEKYWKMIKVELREPTTVSKSDIVTNDAWSIDEDDLENDY